jgi:hypothetical protein
VRRERILWLRKWSNAWRAKRMAFPNDYCVACEEARRAVQVRTFDVGHIFWIPILPGGYWKRWVWAVCSGDPHGSTKTRRAFKWAGVFILLLFSAVSWAMPVTPDFVAGSWILRIAAPVGAMLTLVHLFGTKKEPSLKARLATIEPAADTVCPFCGAQSLMLGSQCSMYGVVRI